MLKSLIAIVVLIGLVAGPAVCLPSYNGKLTRQLGGITAVGLWGSINVPDVSMEWWVSQINATTWHYKYEFIVEPATSGQNKKVSHIEIETSSPFVAGLPDISNLTVNGFSATPIIDTWSSSTHGGSDPTIPGPMFGLKPDSDNFDLSNIIEFDSTRIPVWGDFYAVDGKNTTPAPSAWNEGFLRADPTVAAHGGTEDNHILRPDTGTYIAPEAGSLMLAVIGLIPIAGVCRLRLRR